MSAPTEEDRDAIRSAALILVNPTQFNAETVTAAMQLAARLLKHLAGPPPEDAGG